MNEHLMHLLDAVWEHDLPLGPEGDLAYRERAEHNWEQLLTVDDCLALLAWVEAPELPPTWETFRERWIPSLIDSAARHVGRAGKRLGDPRIVQRLVALLSTPRRRYSALEGLIELSDPMSFDALLKCLDDSENRISVGIAIAAVASSEQLEMLRAMCQDVSVSQTLRHGVAEVIEECEAVDREGGRRPSRST